MTLDILTFLVGSLYTLFVLFVGMSLGEARQRKDSKTKVPDREEATPPRELYQR